MSNPTHALLSQARRLLLDAPLELIVRLALLAFFAGVAVYYLVEREQSFTIFAQTKAAKVLLEGDKPQYWVISGATLCQRVTGDRSGDAGGGLCDPNYYTTFESEETEVSWPSGTVLTIRGMDATHLSVHVAQASDVTATARFDDIEITDQSILIFKRTSLTQTASLTASGFLSVGEIAETGATHLLQAGTYEIREALGMTSGTSVVATGSFLPGDQIQLEDAQGDRVKTQVLIKAPSTAYADFDLIATSPPRKSAMVVQRIGAAKTQITSRWMDRLANDALPFALSIFLGLLGASLGIAKGLIGSSSTRKEYTGKE